MPRSKICLPDVNVWIAFAWAGRLHHEIAKTWFASLGPGEAAFCRITQMGFLRLITNARVMSNEALSQRNAWAIYEDLSRDKRVTFTIEPAEVEPVWKRYTQGLFTGTNAWFFFIINAFKVPFSIGLGLIERRTLLLNLVLSPVIVAGLVAGRWLIHRVPQRLFDGLLLAFAFLAALRLIGAF